MSHRTIVDAGPGLNSFSVNKERLLFDALGPISVPEVVQAEMARKASQDKRFATAGRVLNKLPERLFRVLPDQITDELAAAVNRIAQMPVHQRLKVGKDLGELMVVAHAVVAAEQGAKVVVLIDDGGGRLLAAAEQRRLDRLRTTRSSLGTIALIDTTTVLAKAAGREYLPDKAALRQLYGRLRLLDDGLLPLEQTGLLVLDVWN